MSATTGLQLRSLITKSGELQLSLVEMPIPEPAADQVVVKVEATPINPSDLGLLIGPADMSTAKATGSRKVETRDNQRKRHRHGRNNFGAVTPAAPERENSGAAFFNDGSCRASVSDADPFIRHRKNLSDMATVSSA